MIDSGEYNECDYGVVIDVFQLLPRDFVQYIDSAICTIYYFVTSDVTAEERYKILRTHDTPNDYTYYKSDDDNYKNCAELVDISKILKEQCILNDLPYYETARNRESVLKDFINSLSD